MGKIRIAIGPMWAGKTSWLISEIEKAQLIEKRILVVSYKDDNRYANDALATHNGNIFKTAEIRKMGFLSPQDCVEIASKYDFVAVDEGQFMKDIAESATNLANAGCDVVISCLSGDYKQEIFSEVAKLIAVADKIHHFNAICMKCKKNKAPFTHRIVSGGDQIIIGGKDKYIVVCRNCLVSMQNV